MRERDRKGEQWIGRGGRRGKGGEEKVGKKKEKGE